MGIILLTELGKTPWQLRFSPFSLLPAVSQLRLPLDTDPLLDTIPVVPSATPTGAPRVSLDTEDTMVVTVMVSTRGRLRLPLDMDPPLIPPRWWHQLLQQEPPGPLCLQGIWWIRIRSSLQEVCSAFLLLWWSLLLCC